MIATYVPSPWAAPAAAPTPARAGTPWLFAREVDVDVETSGVSAGGSPALQWLIKRNCSITPGQLGAVYLCLCAVSLLIAALFFWQGAPFVMAFAGLELLLVGVALLVFARHAGDRETLTLVGHSLHVEQCSGRRTRRTEFVADWLTVKAPAEQGALVQLAGQGKTLRVGRFLRPELRPALARELQYALLRAHAHADLQTGFRAPTPPLARTSQD